MIHAYFTNGMMDNAVVFLESLYETNYQHKYPVLLTTRDLTPDDENRLRTAYPILKIENEPIPMNKVARRIGVDISVLWRWRRQVEEQYITPDNKVWKLMIAADDRPKSLFNVLKRREDGDKVLHFDIDTLFRHDISSLYERVDSFDCCLLLRPNIKPVKAKVTISTMAWKKSKRVLNFFERWVHWIDSLSPVQRPVGYGQTSFWYAYQEVPLNTHTLSRKWGYPGMNKKNNYIWSGAVNKLAKKECALLFGKEIEKL